MRPFFRGVWKKGVGHELDLQKEQMVVQRGVCKSINNNSKV